MPAGRPDKLTPERQERILLALRAGNYLETAAKYAGICPATLAVWITKGRKGRPKYAEFVEAVEKARAEAEVGMVAVIKKAAIDQWQAAAWWLERSFPARFGRYERVDMSAEVTTLKVVTDAGPADAAAPGAE